MVFFILLNDYTNFLYFREIFLYTLKAEYERKELKLFVIESEF